MKKLLGIIALLSGFIALFMVFISGPAYRSGLLELGQAFTLLRWGAFVGIISPPLVIFYSLARKPQGRIVPVLAASAVVGLFSFYLPFSQWQTARSVPPIHDISTDLDNPPKFVDILPLRADAPNPAEYAGDETAEQQREAYPDLGPMVLDVPMEVVFEAVQETVEQRGWELVSAVQEGDGARVEATDTTLWFGFKDDIVIRMQPTRDGVRLDVRSKSRLGKSDVGTNAQRIKSFSERLTQTLAQAQ